MPAPRSQWGNPSIWSGRSTRVSKAEARERFHQPPRIPLACASLHQSFHPLRCTRMINRHNRAGLTLVEALVVIAVIGVIAAMLIPATQAAREASRRAACISHLRQIGLAMHSYHDIMGQLPGGGELSWTLAVLPQLEQASLLSAFNFGHPHSAPPNTTVQSARVDAFLCPSERPVVLDDGAVAGNYVVNEQALGKPLSSIRDGLSATLLGFDVTADWSGLWVIGPRSLSGLIGPETHKDRRTVLFADGSARSARRSPPEEVLRAWMTPSGGEIADPLP